MIKILQSTQFTIGIMLRGMRAYATSLIFGAQEIKPKYYMADLDSKCNKGGNGYRSPRLTLPILPFHPILPDTQILKRVTRMICTPGAICQVNDFTYTEIDTLCRFTLSI